MSYPTELLLRINPDQVYMPLLSKILRMLAACRERGADYYAISGYRPYAEQLKLWCQGRTAAGNIVTHAGPGESPHNFGLAVDFARDASAKRSGLQPTWRPEDYAVLGEEAQKVGLVWGGAWQCPDRPHVQWPGYVTALQLRPVRSVYETSGLTAAWNAVDAGNVA